MTKSRNFRRALSVIMALAFVICFAQTAVFAANTVDVKDGIYDGTNITVTGSISTSGAEMTMLAVITDDENVELSSFATPDDLAAAVQFIDQVTATSDNFEKTWTFALRDGAEGDWVVVFVSGTEAEVARTAISLTNVISGVNGTVTFAEESDFVGSLADPMFTIAGGDEDWADQLEATITDAEGTAVEGASVDVAAGTVTLTAPDVKATYTLTIANTSDAYPAFEETKAFTFVSEAGDEFAQLPANLDVEVDKGEDAYTFTIPEDTDNIEYTVTVDGEVVADRPVVVAKAEEGGANKAVVVTAAAKGTDLSKDYSVTVPAKGVVGPVINEDDVTIIEAEDGSVYADFIAGENIIVTIAAGDIDPETQKVTVNGVEFYYVEKCDYFVGIVAKADKAAIIDAIEVGDGASDTLIYGKDPTSDPEELAEPVGTSDFIAVKRIALGKVDAPTPKQLLAADVGNGEMDGSIDTSDFIAVKRVALEKDDDFAING